MPNFTDKALEFIESTQAKLEELKKDFSKFSSEKKEDVVLILDIKLKGFTVWRFDA